MGPILNDLKVAQERKISYTFDILRTEDFSRNVFWK